ncbi:hypothetical protein J2127_000296 [Methanococcus voltae]|uniref:Uncharacterized protein n=5 Tax=Methanococcus voltae TaxID=2188 RepID=A0A8J7S3J2_METVO|nr:hypothetical protein [Methanococcus voltae]MBP2172266.1 hypothetical protein [Methanococcus voltae]MBP2200778.1 hypothetical protein [Methanococcus voltae]MCS3921502.1 hypothetical protein [Methanococcus voltae PS]
MIPVTISDDAREFIMEKLPQATSKDFIVVFEGFG